jgi:phosphoribosylaminoimidazole-succinocarboxamide synthase
MHTPPVLTRIELPGIPHVRSGKVREVFDAGEHLLFVATDRISAFDCILPTGIPAKGHVLNQLSAWWFQRLSGEIKNHVVSADVADYPAALRPWRDQLRGRSMLVRKAQVIPVECVARGYLIGSGWKDYQRTQELAGMPLRQGYRMADQLDEPVFTPAHKAESGHDENITFEDVVARVGLARATELREITLRLYGKAAEHARTRGLILADTKFEFGLVGDRLIWLDEALTPDSSRYWPADAYQPGTSPPSFDKQFVRDYLETLDWNKQPPAPALPDEVAARTSAKYIEAFERITGGKLVI